MADDPYKALGLSKTATEAEIKKAYRRIAKTDHPDLNPDPKAAERFKRAAAAYDLLKDADKRRRFDAGEIDAAGQERPQRHYYREYAGAADNPYAEGAGYGGDFSDVFSDLFSGRARGGGRRRSGGFEGFGGQGVHMRGQDLRFTLAVDFMTAALGGATRVTLPEGGSLEVTIPEGAHDGQTIRLRGKGGAGYGDGGPGDAYLTLSVEAHPTFTRNGNDIEVTLPISLPEAVLGGKVEAPTIHGTVNLSIPRGASSGQRLRLRGRGVKGDGGTPGDQFVVLRIVSPPRIDDELARFMEDWRTRHDYDPRKGMPT